MIEQNLQRVDQAIRHFLPTVSIIIATFLSVVIIPVPNIGSITPQLGLMTIFVWALYRPDLLRPSAVFFLGLLNDCLQGTPLGITAIVWLGVYQLVVSLRRLLAGFAFQAMWIGFAITSVAYAFVIWILMLAFGTGSASLLPILVQSVISIALFPLPSYLLLLLHRFILGQP